MFRQSDYFDIPYIDIENYEINVCLFSLCSIEVWKYLVCLPVIAYGDIVVISASTISQELKERLEKELKKRVLFVRSDRKQIENIIARVKNGYLGNQPDIAYID